MSLPTQLFLRKFSTSSLNQNAIKNVTIIGGGLMGAGIAQVMRKMFWIHHYYYQFNTPMCKNHFKVKIYNAGCYNLLVECISSDDFGGFRVFYDNIWTYWYKIWHENRWTSHLLEWWFLCSAYLWSRVKVTMVTCKKWFPLIFLRTFFTELSYAMCWLFLVMAIPYWFLGLLGKWSGLQ